MDAVDLRFFSWRVDTLPPLEASGPAPCKVAATVRTNLGMQVAGNPLVCCAV